MNTCNNHSSRWLWVLLLSGIAFFHGSQALAQGTTTITYQGLLKLNGLPASGLFDLNYSAFSSSVGSTLYVGAQQNGVLVTNGLFTVQLPIGPIELYDPVVWLEIGVRTNGGSSFTTLSPRQQLTAAPYAVYAQTAATVTTNSITPTQINTSNSASNGYVLAYSGGSLVWQNPATNVSAWALSGNSGVNPTNGAFLGTTDNQPLELHVNGSRVLRLEPDAGTNGAPNVIAGSSINFVSSGVLGATIAGGGATQFPDPRFFDVSPATNAVLANYGTVGGGVGNTASGIASVVAGGGNNDGLDGNIASGNHSVVSGGSADDAAGDYSVVGGGLDNSAFGFYSTASGGAACLASGDYSTVSGGSQNMAIGHYSAVVGGYYNTASGDYSFAAGCTAQATNDGTFVWADSSTFNLFTSTSPNQFLIRAAGNVGINTTNPGSDLTVVHANAGGRGAELSLVNPANSNVGNEVAINFGTDPTTYNADLGNAQIKARSVNVNNATDLIFSTYNGSSFSERMRLQNGGNLGIGTTNPAHLLTVGSAASPAYCNGSTWVNASDRSIKTGFKQVDPQTVLEKVASLSITEWQYKSDGPGLRHIGPVAQDFHSSFNLNGDDDKHISTVDESGVALAAIQGLNQKLNEKLSEKDAEIRDEDAEIKDLKRSVEELKKMMRLLADKK